MSENHTASWEVERNWARDGQPPNWEPTRYRPKAHISDWAAEAWAEHHDSEGDYSIVGGSSVHVRVRKADSKDAWEEFTVTGESEPVYRAEPATRTVHAQGPIE